MSLPQFDSCLDSSCVQEYQLHIDTRMSARLTYRQNLQKSASAKGLQQRCGGHGDFWFSRDVQVNSYLRSDMSKSHPLASAFALLGTLRQLL